MLQGLEKAEKSPNKGFKVYPNFEEPEQLSGKEEEEEDEDEDEDEVVLLDDPSDKTSKQGGTKQCRSSQFKEAHEYHRKGFKIPKKSSQNDHHSNLTSSNVSQETEKSFLSKYNHKKVDSWGFKSSFSDNETSAMKTKLTRNSNFKSKPGRGRNIRQMMQRQDSPCIGLIGKSSRNTSSFLKHNTRMREEPFDNEINQVMNRSTRTIDPKEKNSIMSNNRDCKVIIDDLKNGNNSAQEKQSRRHKTDRHDKEHTTDSSTADDSEVQYSKNLYQENSLELNVTSDSEQDFQQNQTAESKNCNHEEISTKKKEGPQRKLLSFPSSAATPRHSIHEHSTSEDDKDKSNTTTFYGSENKSGVIKTYGGRKCRTINNKSGWRKDDDQEVSDVEESPVENSKKRKIHVTTRKNVKKNANNSNCEKQRKKHKTEPECLLISSSDEEDNQSGLGDGNVSGTESAISKNKSSENVPTNTPSKPTAENNVTANGQATGVYKTTGAVDNPFERDSFTTEIMLGPKVMLGKLKGSADGALEITAHQLKWRMKYTDENDKPAEQVVLILASDLTSFKIHVDNDPKVIVLEVNQRCALKLRGKFQGLGKFFDPSSAVVEETDIVLEIEDTLSAETLADITEWVYDRLGMTLTELSHEEAEKLSERLNSSTNSASKNDDNKQKSRYNTRSSTIKSTTRTAVTPTKMIIYPFPPTPGGITVTSADVECLAEGEFLNDVIIDFYLKYIYHDKLSEDDKNRTHIFSSFFYKRLTQKNSFNNEFFESPHDRMHNQVKKWTRNVDIFSKDFIIVPINESSHWYLAIICFPNLDEPIIEESSSQEPSEENETEESADSDDKEKAKVNVDDDVDDDDEDDTEFETSALAEGAKKGTPSKKAAQKNKPVLKANPCILIFDSLANTGRSRVFTNLRNYLSREWKARRPDKPTREFTAQSFKGAFPKVPEQDNHCDCGIFVLQYVESFFEDPIKDYSLPIHKTNWFTHNGISGERQEIKNLILRLKEKYTSTLS